LRTKEAFKRVSVLAVAVLGMLAFASPAWAETFTVTNKDDSGDGSLRAALTSAAADQGTADVVEFGSGVRGEIVLTSALPDLGNVEIVGPGANVLTVRRSSAEGTPEFRIFTVVSGVTAKISGLTISGGRSDNGGGIFNNGGTVSVSNSTISGNSASNAGGGIQTAFGPVNVSNSTISGNSAVQGGGILNNNTMSVSSSTISGNSASNAGGGIFNQGTASVSNSTISGNSASDFGGGISNASNVTVKSSIVAGNAAGSGPDLFGELASGSAFNLIGGTASAAGLQTDASGKPVLTNNGGPTPTIALISGSPAIDQGKAFDTTTDQRGFLRPQDFTEVPNAEGGDGSDIGAFERVLSTLSISDAPTVTEGDTGSITDVVFTVRRSGTATGTVTVDYATEDGTATSSGPSSDYQTTTGTLTFAANETEKTITVPVNGDELDESDETFLVRLSNPQGADLLLAGSATGTITDDDDPEATDDSYTTRADGRLVVDAPGVLENDSLPQSNAILVARVDRPSSGILSLENDGSFRYAPDPGFVGEDSFTYKVSDSNGESDPATVTITVRDGTAPTITAVTPKAGTKLAKSSTNVTATFSESIDIATLTDSTFTLVRKSTGEQVEATVTYSPSQNRAVLNPDNDLMAGAAYTATVKGGASGIEDTASNSLSEDKAWTFSVNSAPKIEVLVPEPGSRTTDRKPAIRAVVKDPQSVLSASNIKLSLDDNEITDFSYNRSTGVLRYAPPGDLSYGRHQVKIEATDPQGLQSSRTWYFRVVR
jgi:hypothetical protein